MMGWTPKFCRSIGHSHHLWTSQTGWYNSILQTTFPRIRQSPWHLFSYVATIEYIEKDMHRLDQRWWDEPTRFANVPKNTAITVTSRFFRCHERIHRKGMASIWLTNQICRSFGHSHPLGTYKRNSGWWIWRQFIVWFRWDCLGFFHVP